MDEPIKVNLIPEVIEASARQAQQRLNTLGKPLNVDINANIKNADLDKNIGRSLGRITGQADEFKKSMDAANARVIAFGASVGTINLISKAFQGLISSAIEVEDAVRKISISGNETFKDLQKVSAGLFEISKYTTTSFKDASAAVLEFSRQGKSLTDSLTAARAALVLTRNTGLDAAEAVRGLTAVVNVFNKQGLDYESVVNKMATVDTKFAVSSKDLIEGINRSASVAQEAKVSFEELTALITVLQEKTGRGGPVIGNSLKTIFTRVQNPEILKDLKNLGILVTDNNQEFLSATQILVNLAKGYENLDSNLKKSVLLKIGGGFQVDKLAALFDSLKNAGRGADLTQFEKVLNAANSKDNSAAFRKTEEQAKSLEGRLNRLSAAGKQLSDSIAEVGFRKNAADKVGLLSSLVESASKNISEGEKAGGTVGQSIVKGIGAAFTGPGAVIFGGLFLKFTYDFIKFASSALQSLTGVTKKTKEEESIQQNIFSLLTRNQGVQKTLLELEGNKVAQAKFVVDLYTKAANELERAAKWSKEIAPVAVQAGISTSSGTLVNKRSSGNASNKASSAAKGYIPNFTNESQAYQNEVANAPAGAKIIRHTNFPLGGGKKAPVMFTNDKETLIPNFAGTGGTAVIPRYRTSANGFIPNFADKASVDKGTLNVDATNFGIGGLSLGTDVGNKTQRYQGGFIGKTKGKELRTRDGQENAYLKSLKGSPLYSALKDYSKVQVSNLPVGAVYSFAKGIRDNEAIIKKQFVSRANNQISGSIATFILSELKNLGLKIPSQFENALKSNPQSFDLIDDSSAGGFFEKIVQYASLNGRPVESLKANEKTPFDIYGLAARDAESFGLPSKSFRYVEVKSSIQELYDSITEKFVRQSQIETATPKAGSAANGYIPNFAKDPLKESISREVKATGLPLSKIKVSKDPRLFSASKNPLGLGVTNAKDEPRGMSDVSSGRIAESYASSVFGYIPNFAVKGGYKVTSLSPEQQELVAQYKEQTGETKNPSPEQFKAYFGQDLVLPTKTKKEPTPSEISGPKRGRPTGSTNRKTTTPTLDQVTQAASADKNKFTGVDRGTMKDLEALSRILDQGGIELNEGVFPGADQPPLTVSETRNYGEAGLTRRARAEQFAQSQLAPNEAEFRKEFLSNEVKGTYSELSDEEFNKLNEKYLKIARKYDDLVEKFETLDKENRLDEKQTLTGAKVPGVNVPFKSGSKVGTGNVAASATENAQKASGPKKTKGSSKTAAAGGGSGGGSGGGGNSGGSGSAASDDEGNFSTDKTPLTPAQIEANAKFDKQYASELREYSSEKPTESIPAAEKSTTASASESAQKTAASSRTRTSKSSGKASGAAGGGGGAGGAGGAGVGGGSFSSGGPIPVNVIAPKPLEVKIVASSIKFGETISDRTIKDVVDRAIGEKTAKQQAATATSQAKFPFETKSTGLKERDFLTAQAAEKQKTQKERETAAVQAKAAAEKAAAEQSAKQREAAFAKARNPSLGEAYYNVEKDSGVKELKTKPKTFAEIKADLNFQKTTNATPSLAEIPTLKKVDAYLGVNQPSKLTGSDLFSAKQAEQAALEKRQEASQRRKQLDASGVMKFDPFALLKPAKNSLEEQSAILEKAAAKAAGENRASAIASGKVSELNFASLPASSLVDLANGNINPSAAETPRYLPPLSLGGAPRLNPNSDYEKSLAALVSGGTKIPSAPESNLFSGLREKTEYVPPSLVPSAQSSKPKNSAITPNVGKSKLYPAVDLSGYEKLQNINNKYQKDPFAGTSFNDLFGISPARQETAKPNRSALDSLSKIFSSSPPRKLNSPSLIPDVKEIDMEEVRKREKFAPTEQQAADAKAFMQSVRDKIGTAVPQKSKLQLDSSLLTGEGLSGSKTIFRSLKPEQIEKLKKEIEFLTTQFQKNGKPMASLEEVTKMVSKRLRDFGVNIKPEGLMQLATATNKSEKQRLEAVRNAQRTTPNITFSTGTPMEIPESDIRRRSGFSYAVRDQLTNLSNYASSAYQGGRGLLGNFAGKTEEEKRKDKELASLNKSAVESVAALGRLFTITTALSAALSVFGEKIANAGQAAASAFNAFYSFKEGLNAAAQLRGEVEVRNAANEVIGTRSSRWGETLDRALAARRDAMTGTAGTPATGLLGQAQGASAFLTGGGLALVASGFATVAAGLTAAVAAANALDSAMKFLDEDVVKGAAELSEITKLQKKYNLTLSEGSRLLSGATSKIGESGSTGFYGYLNRENLIPRVQKLGALPGADIITPKLANLRMQPEAQKAFYSSLNEVAYAKAEEQQRNAFNLRRGIFAPGGSNEPPRLEENGEKPKFENYINYEDLQKTANDIIIEFLDNAILESKKEFTVRKKINLYDVFLEGIFTNIPFVNETPKFLQRTEVTTKAPRSSAGNITSEASKLTEEQAAKSRPYAFRGLGNLMKKEEDSQYARFKRDQGSLGVSKEYLNAQLTTYTKISDAISNLTTSEEYLLQIRKENSFVSEKQKDLDELRLKLIQNERQARQDINSIVTAGISQEIAAKIQPLANGMTEKDFLKFTDAFKKITIDLPVSLNPEQLQEELKSRVKNIFSETLGLGKASEDQDTLNSIIEQATATIFDQVQGVNKINEGKTKQIKLEYDSLQAIKSQKYFEDTLREALDARLTIQQKNLSLLKEERDLRLSIKENELKTSLIGNYNLSPRRAEMILRENAPEQQKARDESAIRARRDESFLSLRKTVIDYTLKNNPSVLNNTEEVNKLLTTTNRKDLLDSLTQAIEFKQDQIQPLKDATDYFKQNAADYFKEKVGEVVSFLKTGIVDIVRGKTTPYLIAKPEDKAATSGIPFRTGEVEVRSENTSPNEKKINEAVEKVFAEVKSVQKVTAEKAQQLITEQAAARRKAAENQANLLVAAGETPIPKNLEQDKDVRYRLGLTEARRQNKLTSDFEGGLMGSRIQMNEDIEFFANKMGREIPDSFRDSMVSAMRELSNPNSTEPLKNRLLGVANAFLQKINESLMTNLANKITSPITGLFTPEMKASGGMINGGSGSKDDVPAMLMGGEYVIKKSAVKKYGPSFFDALNNGRIQKFASGGFVEADLKDITLNSKNYTPYGQVADQGLSFDQSGRVIGMDSYSGTEQNKQDAMMRAQSDYYAKNAQTGQGGFYMPGQEGMGSIMGQKNLLSFATQEVAGTKFDKFSSMNNAASIDIGAGSSNLSLFALRDQDNIRNKAYQESRQKSLDLYFGGIDASKEKIQRDEEARLEIERIKQEQKTQYRKMYQGLIRNALISIGTSVAAAGVSNAMNSGSQKGLQGKTDKINNSIGSDLSGLKSGDFQGYNQAFESRGLQPGQWADITNTKLSTLESFKYGSAGLFGYGGYKSNQYVAGPSGGAYSWSGGGYKSLSNDQFNNTFKYGAQYGSAMQNNFVPMSRMQRRAAGGYVAGNGLGDNVPTMLNGGEFVVSRQAAQNVGLNKLQQINSGSGESSISDTISEKLDELIDKLNAVGTVNITVNSNGNGKDESEDSDQNSQDNQKQLARRIKEVVMSVLREEKRLGGILR